MAAEQFDNVARKMADGANRRTVLKGIGGLTLGSLGFLAAREAGSAQDDSLRRRCNRSCLRRCRRGNGDDCRERCCRGDDNDD